MSVGQGCAWQTHAAACRTAKPEGRAWHEHEPKPFTIPQIMLIAGTRAALGAGVAMLIADRIDRRSRRGTGWSLLAVGVLTTVPLLMSALGKPPVREPAKTPAR